MFRFLLIIQLFLILQASAQAGPRTWEDHTGLNSVISIAKFGTKIYASNYNGVVYFDESEVSPRSLTKINGLSDVGVTLLRVNPYNDKLIVVYENCNIDIIDAKGNIKNYPDFKLKSLSGKKTINEVSFYKNIAYLACGFGIVAFDTEKIEIRDTYYIGPNATALEVFQVAVSDSAILAATSAGLYASDPVRKTLSNYKSWIADSVQIPKGPYMGVIYNNNRFIACYSPFKTNNSILNSDTFFTYINSAWIKTPGVSAGTYRRFGNTYQDMFSFIDLNGMQVRKSEGGNLVMNIGSYNGIVDYGTLRDIHFSKDHTMNLSYWVADALYGLYQCYGYYPGYWQINANRNGMVSSYASQVDVFEGKVAVAPSHVDVTGGSNALRTGINIFENGEWSYIPAKGMKGEEVLDINSVLIDRKDKTRVWATSWFYGVLEYKDGKLVAEYTPAGTGLPALGKTARAAGLSMDKNGNVIFANSNMANYLSVIRRSDRQFINLKFNQPRFIRRTFIDSNNQIWILHERNEGLTVYKSATFSTPIPDQKDGSFYNYRVLSKDIGNGNLGSNDIYCIAEDSDKKIWVGTGAGLRVFYNPSSVLTSSDYDAQPIKIVQDGNVELLLAQEAVTSIVIDGANNKWVGTAAGGVYCFSSDGVRELYHFTEENSPLYSNTIFDLNYIESTGDIFIASDMGVQSYRSTIIKGKDDYSEMFAYPNPVRPGYQGSVFVRGLLDNSVVKITDISGNLVWETKSTGGQIEWPVKNLSGARVTSGVYVVYSSTTNGEIRALTKVMVAN